MSVLACDARYCKAQFCNPMSSVHVCVHPSVMFVDQDHIGCNLSEEWVKVRTSNFVRTVTVSIGTKVHKKCREN